MSKREAIKTKKEEIISYWKMHQSECGLSVDWEEADQRCWRCGCESKLERCHAEGPNVRDPEIMWDWIRAYGVTFYDSFWGIEGLKEYELYLNRATLAGEYRIVAKAFAKKMGVDIMTIDNA